MNAKRAMAMLVRATHSSRERARFLKYESTHTDREVAVHVGHGLLERSPPRAGACTYLTAAWALSLREEHGLAVFCVVGDLRVRGVWAFRTSGVDISRQLTESSDGWDGHCWLQLGHRTIGDIATCRTAYVQPDGSNLKAAILDAFGAGRGLFVMERRELLDQGFEYMPRHVMSNTQMRAIVNGAAGLSLL